jgi:hypothetical protein
MDLSVHTLFFSPSGSTLPMHFLLRFSCMRCVNLCPVKAKELPSPVRENISNFLSQFQSNQRQNELFL